MKIKILCTFGTSKFIRWLVKKEFEILKPTFLSSKLFQAFHSALFDKTLLGQNTFYTKEITKNSAVNRQSLYNWKFTRHYQFHLTIKPRSVLLSVWLCNCSAPDTSSILLPPCASPYVFTENKEEEKWDVGHNKQCNHSRYFTATETETLLFLQLLSALVTFRSTKKGVNFVFVCIRRQL